MALIAIVDYGMGNIHSVERALRHAAPEADIRLCSQACDILAADRVVFPGQGAMADCIRTLDEAGLREAVLSAAKSKPLLGVCVGEQMLFERSEEGNTTSLGIFKGEVRHFQGPAFSAGAQQLKVPHMGWNTLDLRMAHPLLAGIATGEKGLHAYFVHSYELKAAQADMILATTNYGGAVTAMVGRDNIAGTQFHPEKSQTLGLALIANFMRWTP